MNSMEHRSCPYANSCSAGQDLPRTLWNLKVHSCVHNSQPLLPIPQFCFFNSRCNVILPTTLRSSKWSPNFRLPGEKPAFISYLPPACHMLSPLIILYMPHALSSHHPLHATCSLLSSFSTCHMLSPLIILCLVTRIMFAEE